MDFTGRPMKGYIYVDAEGIGTKKQLAYWLKLGIGHVRTLPPKGSKARVRKPGKTPAKRLR
jgi:hypothetical protein